MPALFAAFYVETTLTCLPRETPLFSESGTPINLVSNNSMRWFSNFCWLRPAPPPPPSTTPIPSSDRDWVTDWKWDDLTPEQYVLVIGLAIAAGICLVCGGFLVSFLARAEPKPPRRTAKLDRGPALDTGRVIFQPSPEPTQVCCPRSRRFQATEDCTCTHVRMVFPVATSRSSLNAAAGLLSLLLTGVLSGGDPDVDVGQMMSTPPMYQPTPAPLARSHPPCSAPNRCGRGIRDM
eukprot:3617543-Rhodomonas_salina.1